MKNRKITLIVIIVLLCFFLPITIYATILHIKFKNPVIDNPNHEFFYNNKLYFYNEDNLLGTYNCVSNDYCDYASDFSERIYPLNEYKDSMNSKIPIINNRYVFLIDSLITKIKEADIILYDLETNRELGRYKTVKNYGIGISDDVYIVEDKNNKWGVLRFFDGVNLMIPFTYDYIGLSKNIGENGKINASYFAVFKDNLWSLVDIHDKELASGFNAPIVNYNERFVITSESDEMRIYNHNNELALNGSFKYLDLWSKYIAIVTLDNEFYLYDNTTEEEVSMRHNISDVNNLRYEIDKGRLLIYNEEELIENIAIN